MKITDYTIVSKPYVESLQAAVLSLVAEGWQLQGGVSVSGDDKEVYYTQAMVKVEAPKSTFDTRAEAEQAAKDERIKRELAKKLDAMALRNSREYFIFKTDEEAGGRPPALVRSAADAADDGERRWEGK